MENFNMTTIVEQCLFEFRIENPSREINAAYNQWLKRPLNQNKSLSSFKAEIKGEMRQFYNKFECDFIGAEKILLDKKYINFSEVLDAFNLETEVPQSKQCKGLNIVLADNQATKLHEELIGAGFIDKSTNIDNFKLVFGCNNNLHENITPIKWTASTKQNNGYYTSKGALLELLRTLSVSFDKLRNKKLLKSLFAGKDGMPLVFSTKNLQDAERNEYRSEYHEELLQITNNL